MIKILKRFKIQYNVNQWVTPFVGVDFDIKDIYIGFLCFIIIIDLKKHKGE